MNRRQVACVAGLVVAVVAIDLAGHHPSHATTRPSPAARTVDWQQRLDDARTELEANTTALQAASLTGQPVDQLEQQCRNAVADYNAAAPHTDVPPIDPSKECAR